jgi:hypothetical protein
MEYPVLQSGCKPIDLILQRAHRLSETLLIYQHFLGLKPKRPAGTGTLPTATMPRFCLS